MNHETYMELSKNDHIYILMFWLETLETKKIVH